MTVAADNARIARARTLAGRALGWWLAELGALYDDAARSLTLGGRNDVVLEAGERYWIVRQRQRPLGQIDRAGADEQETRRALKRLVGQARRAGALIVEIPQERVLAKRIALPAMAERELERILQFEIARHFPFPAERVFFRHRIVGGAGPSGRGAIEVEIAAVPREVIGDILDELGAAGLRPRAVAMAGAAGAAPLILPLAALGRDGARLAWRDRALLATLIVLGAAALVSPALYQRMRIAALAGEINAIAPRAQTILGARERAAREAARTASPLRLRAARPPLVVVLDELTKAVPDGAWLTSLSLSGHELVMDGLSPSAAATVLALERSRVFANVVFRSPIARDPVTGLEHFQLSAAIAEPKP